MKKLVVAIALTVAITSHAEARVHRHYHHVRAAETQSPWDWWRGTATWATPTEHTSGLSSECRTAARQGGPCGCWATEHFGLPRMYHGHNLWLAKEWAAAFPHTSPAPGTAAVFGRGYHVAPVVAVNGDGTVTVADSWATHNVRISGLTFVNPR